MHNVLVIDDDCELYSLLHDYFAETEFRSEHAADAESGLARLLAAPETWDAVILDVMLPGVSGVDALKRLRAMPQTGDLPILMLTALGAEGERVAGLEAGADDYLAKPFSLKELAARLRAILRRSGKRDTERTGGGDTLLLDNMVVDRSALTAESEGRSIRLTPTEMRLLEILGAEPGKTVSRDSLYKHVFGHPAHHYDRGLDMAVSRLRKKLGRRADGGERIQAVWGEGYVFLLKGTHV